MKKRTVFVIIFLIVAFMSFLPKPDIIIAPSATIQIIGFIAFVFGIDRLNGLGPKKSAVKSMKSLPP